MTHANPHTHSNMPWHTTRHPRLWMDAILALVIVLSLAFLATRTNSAFASAVRAFLPGRSAEVEQEPLLRSVDRATVPELIAALKDPVPSVRISSAEALGSKHAEAASDALLAATYDSNARVREEAAAALGEIGDIKTLPRLRELEAVSGNTLVEMAAFEAEGKITADVAAALNVPRSGVQALTVTQNGVAYAAALNDFYTLRGNAWQQISHLPAIPNDISAAPDGRLIFMSTDSSGLYQSQDGGGTWEHLQYGMQTPTQLKTTAVAVNPRNTDQVFAALAVNGSTSDLLNPLGIASSNDGGKTWSMLPNSANSTVTRALIIDRTNPRLLYGLSDVGSWGYQLPPDAASTR